MSASVTACHDAAPGGSGAAGFAVVVAGTGGIGWRRFRLCRDRSRRGRSRLDGLGRRNSRRARWIHRRVRVWWIRGRNRGWRARRHSRGRHGGGSLRHHHRQLSRRDACASADPSARFGKQPDRRPCRERHREPGLAAARGKPLLRVPAEHLAGRHRARRADEHEREQVEAHGAQSVARHRRLQRLDRVAAREERRDVLRPVGQAREPDRDAADDQHRQEDALSERLHRGHVVGHHRHHEAQAEKRERDEGERHPEIEWMARQRHAHRHRKRELQQPRGDERDVAGRHRAGDQAVRGDRRQPIPPPHPALTLAHHRRRQPEAGAAERGHRQQLAHVRRQRDALVAVEHPEDDEKHQRKQIAIDQRHLVSEVQPERDLELMQPTVHVLVVGR